MLNAKQLIGINGGIKKTAERYGITDVAVRQWRRRGIPEHIALLCHLSPDIPYMYNPADYGRDPHSLGVSLIKPTK